MLSDLGTLGGESAAGYAINSTGQIVGTSAIAGSADQRAFFYNGAMSDLNTFVSASDPLKAYVTLTEARGINNDRLIVVNGVDSRDQAAHVYLLQAPWSDVSPGLLSFPSTAVGSTSATQAVTLKNSGVATMALGNTTIAGDFTQTNNCGTNLAPGATCTANVAFQPTVGGNSTGILTFVTDGYPITAHLAGVSPLIVSMTASTTTPLVGAPVAISWTSAPSAQCTVQDTSANNGFYGSKTANGSKEITHTAPGTFVYKLECTAGAQTASGSVSVTASWPVPTASITASPTTITAGGSTTLTWSSTNADRCVASGGGGGDNWAGPKAASGSVTVTEPLIPATPSVTLTFTINCSSDASGLSAQASANVVDNAPTEEKSGGGGGAMDLWSLLFLFGASAGLLQRRAVLSRRRV